jgi:hypothetical protein
MSHPTRTVHIIYLDVRGRDMTPTEKGNRSEALMLAALVASGRRVLLPFGDGARYDLVIDEGPAGFSKVQVKSAGLHGDIIRFRPCSHTGGGRQPYGDDVDFFGVVEPQSGRCFLIPSHVTPPSTCTCGWRRLRTGSGAAATGRPTTSCGP